MDECTNASVATTQIQPRLMADLSNDGWMDRWLSEREVVRWMA